MTQGRIGGGVEEDSGSKMILNLFSCFDGIPAWHYSSNRGVANDHESSKDQLCVTRGDSKGEGVGATASQLEVSPPLTLKGIFIDCNWSSGMKIR